MVKAVTSAGMPVVLHGGALWDQPTRLSAERRAYIRQNDDRIAALAGLLFGAAYIEGVLSNRDTVFWSRPTIAALVAAGALRPGADLDMLNAIQTAHYVSGRSVTEDSTLIDLAGSISLPPDEFAAAMREGTVDAHIERTRRLMARFNFRGFPSFLLQVDERLMPVPHEQYYARPDAFVGAIRHAAASVELSGESQA
jgi:putative protein-disulfide isomerase